MSFLYEFLRACREYLLKQPWAIIAVVGAIGLLAFQMIRGEALVCANGAIFAKQCGGTEFPRNAIVAFAQEDCPSDSGWQRYENGKGRFIAGIGRHTENDPYGNPVEPLKFGETGGNRTHRLSLEEMPKHTHRYTFSSGRESPSKTDTTPREFGLKDTDEATSPAGQDRPHNNMPPYIALSLCTPKDS